MNVTFNKRGDALIVAVKGRMDAITAPEFESKCSGQIEEGLSLLIADFTELEYISSAGLRGILQIAKRLKQNKGQITFCCLSPMVHNVFSISGFNSMFSLYDSLDQVFADLEK